MKGILMEFDTAKEVFADPIVNSLGIDIGTDAMGLVISKLKKLISTIDIQDGGVYHMDHTYSQVWIKTTLTEDQLDDWCYKTSFPREVEIVGVFEKEW